MGVLTELKRIRHAVSQLNVETSDLPAVERLVALRGLPAHLRDGVGLLSTRLIPEAVAPETPAERRVLVLHGYGGSPSSHILLRRHLSNCGFAPIAIDLRGHDTIREMGEQVADWLLEHTSVDEPIAVVAHSMGGLVVRCAIRNEEARQRIERVVTLGTPHAGTALGQVADLTLADQLERDAGLQETLSQQDPWTGDLPRLICFWSKADLLMKPPETARADGAEHRLLEGSTHYGYMIQPEVWRAVVESLRD